MPMWALARNCSTESNTRVNTYLRACLRVSLAVGGLNAEPAESGDEGVTIKGNQLITVVALNDAPVGASMSAEEAPVLGAMRPLVRHFDCDFVVVMILTVLQQIFWCHVLYPRYLRT